MDTSYIYMCVSPLARQALAHYTILWVTVFLYGLLLVSMDLYHSQTCIKRPPLGDTKSGVLIQEGA